MDSTSISGLAIMLTSGPMISLSFLVSFLFDDTFWTVRTAHSCRSRSGESTRSRIDGRCFISSLWVSYSAARFATAMIAYLDGP